MGIIGSSYFSPGPKPYDDLDRKKSFFSKRSSHKITFGRSDTITCQEDTTSQKFRRASESIGLILSDFRKSLYRRVLRKKKEILAEAGASETYHKAQELVNTLMKSPHQRLKHLRRIKKWMFKQFQPCEGKVNTIARIVFSHAGLLILLLLYTFAGAYLFMTIEGPQETKNKISILRIRDHLLGELWDNATSIYLQNSNYSNEILISQPPLTLNNPNSNNNSTNNLSSNQQYNAKKEEWFRNAKFRMLRFEEILYKAYKRGRMESNSETRLWTFWGALFYSGTIYTTIGYGHIAPTTIMGRLATILYAVIGIPLMLVALGDFGKLLTRAIKFFWVFIRRYYYTGQCRQAKFNAMTQLGTAYRMMQKTKAVQQMNLAVDKARQTKAMKFVEKGMGELGKSKAGNYMKGHIKRINSNKKDSKNSIQITETAKKETIVGNPELFIPEILKINPSESNIIETQYIATNQRVEEQPVIEYPEEINYTTQNNFSINERNVLPLMTDLNRNNNNSNEITNITTKTDDTNTDDETLTPDSPFNNVNTRASAIRSSQTVNQNNSDHRLIENNLSSMVASPSKTLRQSSSKTRRFHSAENQSKNSSTSKQYDRSRGYSVAATCSRNDIPRISSSEIVITEPPEIRFVDETAQNSVRTNKIKIDTIINYLPETRKMSTNITTTTPPSYPAQVTNPVLYNINDASDDEGVIKNRKTSLIEITDGLKRLKDNVLDKTFSSIRRRLSGGVHLRSHSIQHSDNLDVEQPFTTSLLNPAYVNNSSNNVLNYKSSTVSSSIDTRDYDEGETAFRNYLEVPEAPKAEIECLNEFFNHNNNFSNIAQINKNDSEKIRYSSQMQPTLGIQENQSRGSNIVGMINTRSLSMASTTQDAETFVQPSPIDIAALTNVTQQINSKSEVTDPELVEIVHERQNIPKNESLSALNKVIDRDKQKELLKLSYYAVDDEFNLPVSVAMFLLLAYLFLGGVVFAIFEPTWDYILAFYFCFISISTIGLGDVVPEHPFNRLIASIYIFIGLSLTSMCINVFQAYVRSRYNRAAEKIKKKLKWNLEARKAAAQAGGPMGVSPTDYDRDIKKLSEKLLKVMEGSGNDQGLLPKVLLRAYSIDLEEVVNIFPTQPQELSQAVRVLDDGQSINSSSSEASSVSSSSVSTIRAIKAKYRKSGGPTNIRHKQLKVKKAKAKIMIQGAEAPNLDTTLMDRGILSKAKVVQQVIKRAVPRSTLTSIIGIENNVNNNNKRASKVLNNFQSSRELLTALSQNSGQENLMNNFVEKRGSKNNESVTFEGSSDNTISRVKPIKDSLKRQSDLRYNTSSQDDILSSDNGMRRDEISGVINIRDKYFKKMSVSPFKRKTKIMTGITTKYNENEFAKNLINDFEPNILLPQSQLEGILKTNKDYYAESKRPSEVPNANVNLTDFEEKKSSSDTWHPNVKISEPYFLENSVAIQNDKLGSQIQLKPTLGAISGEDDTSIHYLDSESTSKHSSNSVR